MRKYIKKLLVITLIILSCTLTACFKKDTLGFISGEYKYTPDGLVCSFDGAVLEDVSLKVIEIDRETYIQHDKTCVLENRYSNKCYSISLHMQIDSILYNDFEIYELKGSSYENDQYHLRVIFTINDRKYDCYLNLHLNHYIWEYECQDNEANAINAGFSEYLGPDAPQNKTDIVTGKSYGTFSLSYSNGQNK